MLRQLLSVSVECARSVSMCACQLALPPLQVDTGEAETCTTMELFEKTLETAISNAGATPYSRSTIPGVLLAPSVLVVG